MTGANFDGVGLTRASSATSVYRCGKRVLPLGAAGGARGALLPFLEQQPAEANAPGEQFAGYGTLVTTGYEELAQKRG